MSVPTMLSLQRFENQPYSMPFTRLSKLLLQMMHDFLQKLTSASFVVTPPDLSALEHVDADDCFISFPTSSAV